MSDRAHRRQTKRCFKSIRISISRRRKRSYPLRPLLSLETSLLPIGKGCPSSKLLSQQALALGLHLWKNSLPYHTRHPNPHSHPHLNPMRHQAQSNQTLEPVQKLRMKLTIKSVFKKGFSHKIKKPVKESSNVERQMALNCPKRGAFPETS